jgi:hypothetical protein
MVISRIGSLVVGPILKKCNLLKFIEYNKFVEASKRDEKIDILSEANNVCRSLIALCLSLMIAVGYEWLFDKIRFVEKYNAIIILVGILVVFVFAYRKQTAFVVKRCKANLEEK